jgi:hypothetical protein
MDRTQLSVGCVPLRTPLQDFMSATTERTARSPLDSSRDSTISEIPMSQANDVYV